MRKQKRFVCGVIMLVLMLFTSCATGPTSPLSFEDAEAVVYKMLRVASVYDFNDGVLHITTIEFPDNPTEAELSRATGWPVELGIYPGPDIPGSHFPWIEYDQPITADGMHFVTNPGMELGFGNDMGFNGYVENINGCLVINTEAAYEDGGFGLVIPIFGKWRSVAPNLLSGDYIRAGGSFYGNVGGDGGETVVPEQCRNSGITEYFGIVKVSTVNCLLEPYCLCEPSPSPECRPI